MTMPAPRRIHAPWDKWYHTQIWQKRRRHQFRKQPLCEPCLKRGIVKPATIAHHNPPHGGDWNLFRTGPLESLCKECHDLTTKTGSAPTFSTAIGTHGWPVDLNHPVYQFDRKLQPKT
jgi:hypothetical protein